MLPAPQTQVCLSCHGSQAQADALVRSRDLSPIATPTLLSTNLSRPFVHPISEGAFSRHQPRAVTCTSCHTPHRRMVEGTRGSRFTGRKRLSPRNPTRFEYELCQDCHGSAGATTESLLDISRLTSPDNSSFHPVEGSASERSPSVRPNLTGQEINCTDCHGNSNPEGPRGPHGSSVAYLLRRNYTTVDGSNESANTYALCYECHDRKQILEKSSPFPEHNLHITVERASCATCHSAHGSPDNRALIRFGEETIISGVAPSLRTGLLAYVSESPGSGSCYLTCHGIDHSPFSYGRMVEPARLLIDPALAPFPETLDQALPPGPRATKKRPKKPEPPSE